MQSPCNTTCSYRGCMKKKTILTMHDFAHRATPESTRGGPSVLKPLHDFHLIPVKYQQTAHPGSSLRCEMWWYRRVMQMTQTDNQLSSRSCPERTACRRPLTLCYRLNPPHSGKPQQLRDQNGFEPSKLASWHCCIKTLMDLRKRKKIVFIME